MEQVDYFATGWVGNTGFFEWALGLFAMVGQLLAFCITVTKDAFSDFHVTICWLL